ncbi:uncharacterized protein LOC124457562 [Xenia sp. Carnegie-2017]|uniref:uncharacterized protein LOC124457562 n=1 Tax=Xenia sp. Carnegie-2017 TaxID=2897299 RepID=UPI001F0381B7|nr:uncharacterized protein LOC124457562 [Xenia sp. Carnegie-2017]
MFELGSEQRPKHNFQWGWLHCRKRDKTMLDESFLLMSSDIVKSFLRRKNTLKCLVWESQSIGYWLKDISNLTTFSDNSRLIHRRSSSLNFKSDKDVKKRSEICHSVLGLHQSYPDKMRLYWSIYEKEVKLKQYAISKVAYICKFKPNVNYMAWKNEELWFSEPKPCKNNPIWRVANEYLGWSNGKESVSKQKKQPDEKREQRTEQI